MWSRRTPINSEYETYGLFSGCSRGDLRFLTSIATRLDLPEGRVLARQGGRRREFVIVIAGAAEVIRNSHLVDRIGPGGHHGEFTLVRNLPQPATVVAATPITVDVIAARDFAFAYSTLPSFRANVDRELGRRTAAWLTPAETRTAPSLLPA